MVKMKKDMCDFLTIGCPTCASPEEREINKMRKKILDRAKSERNYWNEKADDPELMIKYMSDIPTEDYCKIEPSGTVLEIGCGVGRIMKDGYYGIDISEKIISIAMKNRPMCHFKVCDGMSIPYEDNKFDSVYCLLVFQHILFETVTTYIQETSRVLKNGGKFTFQFIEGTEDEPFSKHHNLEDILYQLKKSGFSNIQITQGLAHDLWTWVTATKI